MLLILAVVAINAVTGDGIIQHASNAKTEYEKAQAEEEDMLSYYEGVLQSGEVVPTVEQLQEKYNFSYFSSLKRAIENVNGTENTAQDSNAENAVAGLYADSENNKYVVLMRDTEESSEISVTSDMTLNLGGKTLSLTADEAYLNFGADNAVIDGRIGGSTIQKNIEDSSGYGIIFSNGKKLIINAGKYIMEGKYSKRFFAIESNNEESFEISNAQIIVNNKVDVADRSGAIVVQNSSNIKAKINNCNIKVQAITGVALPTRFYTGITEINDSYIYGACDNNSTYGMVIEDNAEIIIKNTDIFADASNNSLSIFSQGIYNQGGILKFYSGKVTGTFSGLQNRENARSYVYGGTFNGYGSGGFVAFQGENGKAYLENTTFITGIYTGKYDYSKFERSGDQAISIGGSNKSYGSNNVVYMDNCEIIGVEGGIAVDIKNLSASTGNVLKISNSRVTGTVQVTANQTLYLGAGMEGVADTQITASGTVDRTTYANVSFKGMDKTLMQGN